MTGEYCTISKSNGVSNETVLYGATKSVSSLNNASESTLNKYFSEVRVFIITIGI